MSDNNIKHFTVLDIEKYHKGLLSPSAMHEMEKAALEDAFLADAMEGYSLPGVNAVTDIAELKKRFAANKEEAKVIPLNAGRNNNFKILRAAVVVAFIAGAAFLAFQFTGNKKTDNNLAELTKPKEETIRSADSIVTFSRNEPAATADKISTADIKNSPDVKISTETKNAADELKNIGGGNNTFAKDQTSNGIAGVPAPVIIERKENVAEAEKIKTVEGYTDQKELAKLQPANKPGNAVKKETDAKNVEVSPVITDKDVATHRNVAANRKADDQLYYKNQSATTFRGRVTDANNIGLPFANVTNPQDNVGTYTDARGNFNLTYPDSVLNVQVRSLGFENNMVQLRGNVANTQIVMQDDKSLNEVVINSQKPNAAFRNKESNIKMEESEPTDGWENYDTYLSNNLNVPNDFKTKQNSGSGSVEVSFEVDKNGDPTNIKVEKSLCNSCDKEAIRLVKDGPKWKRMAAKKGRTMVTIKF